MDGERASSGHIDGRVTGKIALGPREPSASVDLTDRVHLLPCVIKHDGACPISHYFKPRKSDMVADDLTVKEAFFRGRKLHGATIPIPNGYRGYVLAKKKIREGRCLEDADGEENNWASSAEFQNVTYWNHDSLPSKHDPIRRSFHLFAIADALPSCADSSLDHLRVPIAPDYLQVDTILTEHYPTPGDGQHKFLIKWKNMPSTEDSCHTKAFLDDYFPGLLQEYYNSNHSEKDSSKSEGIDAEHHEDEEGNMSI